MRTAILYVTFKVTICFFKDLVAYTLSYKNNQNSRGFTMEFLNKAITAISNVLYQPWCVPLILLFGGMFLTARLKGIQIRLFPECFKVLMDKPKEKNGISSFGALMISTASRVGTGNIIGVAGAICLGGPGAIFWMWITAILGGASAFTESTLAQIFKKRNPDGSSYGSCIAGKFLQFEPPREARHICKEF